MPYTTYGMVTELDTKKIDLAALGKQLGSDHLAAHGTVDGMTYAIVHTSAGRFDIPNDQLNAQPGDRVTITIARG